eukprot:gnl/MRDRNA2_/MRDRNA2_153580_c0_seq1.p1 gnl/MRDRNA2_/MRDRNA2_153580_c0~~gnl/MRDRNA2_/MRDRNA2_153580_c0_seq1.p1  ORF type:complete len:335 (+),score=57.75 gnl/MRDRNA2_/MRDRNA2_153580_c0_seq1:92-1006(+)
MVVATSSRNTSKAVPEAADRQRVSNPVGCKKRSSTPSPKPAAAQSGQGRAQETDANTQLGSQTKNALTVIRQDQRLHESWKQDARSGFLRKVYGILAAQIALTVAIAAMFMFTPSIQQACLRLATNGNAWLQLAVLIPTMVSLGFLMGLKSTYPFNYVLLFVFTLSISVNVGYVCSIFYGTGHGDLILQSLGATTLIVLGLSMYTLYSGKDFSYMGGFLSVALWGLVITGIGGLLFPQMVASLLYGLVGALTFCGYILYDTWRLQNEFNYDDYIAATIELYLDIVNLFLYILEILAKLSDKKKK